MAVPTKIQHPLLRRPGTSQRKRIAESQLLRPEFALIDGRKLGDMLDFVYKYARLVVFQEYKIDAEGQGYVEFSNWLGFFERSLPFTLNRFAKSDFDRLETDLRSSIEAIKQNPDDASLRLLLDFCYFDLIKPLDRLQQKAREYDFERLVTLLDRTARTSLLPSLRRFIGLSNVAAKYFCTTKYDFKVFNQEPWGIPIEELFVSDETVKDVPGGQAGAIEWLGDQVIEAAQRFVVVQRNIAQEIPDFLNESIDVLEKQNDPHLGLLYAFLRLFEHFQGELNGLTQKHLEFFYTEVLQLKRRDMVPDQVHLVFEPAKHLENHRIKQGTVFKDAKDSKNVDILFDLDEEIVIDKAKVAVLKTLYLNHSQGCLNGDPNNCVSRSFVEGLYIAPVANSADGKGGEFKEEQSTNWATLGAKLSKYIAPGSIVPQNHPFGRIGFILASPVLWLNEGQRDVTITIECDVSKNKDLFNACFQKKLGGFNPSESYKITDETIKKVKELFSEKARNFLHEKFANSSPLKFPKDQDWDDFINNEAFKDNPESPEERPLLTVLAAKKDGVRILKELPFTSLLQQLNLHKNLEFIEFNPDQFFQAISWTTGDPLLPKSLNSEIQGFFENPKVFLWDVTELFTLQFSGEEKWFPPGHYKAFLVSKSEQPTESITLRIDAKLDAGEPKVAFYKKEAIKETFKTENPFPMVKIELKPEYRVTCDNRDTKSACCLDAKNKSGAVPIGLYHLFRFLTIIKTDIGVKVSGLKKLVVQNEESLQDVDSVIHPFGARPKLRADFFVGTKELLCKHWNEFSLNVEWKEKPDDFTTHYKDYGKEIDLEIEPPVKERITNESFLVDRNILETGEWLDYGQEMLFPDPQQLRYGYSFSRKEAPEFTFKKFDDAPLGPLTVESRDAFVRLRLRGASFQHAAYPFALARYLMRLAGSVDPLSIEAVKKSLGEAKDLHGLVKSAINDIDEKVKKVKDNLEEVVQNQDAAIKLLQDVGQLAEDIRNSIAHRLNQLPEFESRFNNTTNVINKLLNNAIDLLANNPNQNDINEAIKKIKNAKINIQNLKKNITDEIAIIESDIVTWDKKIEKGVKAKVEEALALFADALGLLTDKCELRLMEASDDINKLEIIQNFKMEFESKKNECAVLLVRAPSDLGKWTIAGFNDFGVFNTELVDPNHDLSKELMKEHPNDDWIINLATSIVGRTLNGALSFLTTALVRLAALQADDVDNTKDGDLAKLLTKIVEAEGHLKIEDDDDLRLPKEPYTPKIKSIHIDYTASSEKVELIHLYPFEDSSKVEELTLQTTLLPTFTDEGTLFIGLEGLRPHSNLQLLFQFAEATADSESDRAEIKWHYLADNQWKKLRTGFELLSDKTEQMTRSGIVKIALPEDISNEGNTLMPPIGEGQHLFWLKISTPHAVAGVAELVGVRAQAALATYNSLAESDLDRVAKTLEPEQIGKTLEPDFGIKKIQQPYKSFGGSVAEAEGAIPIRMSELLRHKGRSVDAFDIEHLVLDAFPELFKCKCISHTMGLSARQYQRDLEVAPGFLIVAVVPDLTKLEPGDMLQPMAPVSTLTKVKKFLKARVSPFARIRVKNPRYEQVHVRVKVRLRQGRDENYYLSQLKTDLRHFLAPWYLGDSDKLSFGQHLVYSDVVGFIEGLEYIDYVTDLRLYDFQTSPDEIGENYPGLKEIVPLTARSILSPGDIETFSDKKDCKKTPESKPDENKLAAFLKSTSPITCGEAQSDLAERKPQPIPMKMRDDRRN